MGVNAGFYLIEALPEEARKESASPVILLREDIGVKPPEKIGSYF